MSLIRSMTAMAVSTTLLAATMGAAVAGPMQSLTIEKDGIDAVPVVVVSVGGKFAKISSPSHTFSLRISAKAKLGKKVKYIQATTSDGLFMEADPGTWSIEYLPNKREFSKELSPNIAMSKIRWSGGDPVKACNAKLKQSRNVLSKGASAQVSAYFQVHAANKSSPTIKTNSDSKWMWYPVVVKCLPASVGGDKSN